MASHDRTLTRNLGSVAEFLLHEYKRMITIKFRASNALLNSAEYAITRKENFSFIDLASC
jgi:hypothetical protein